MKKKDNPKKDSVKKESDEKLKAQNSALKKIMKSLDSPPKSESNKTKKNSKNK